MPPIFVGFAPIFLALAVAYCVLPCVCRLGCCGCFAPIVCAGCGLWWLCCWWWLFSPFGRYDKRKGAPLLVLPLFVRVLWACYMFSAALIASSFDFEKIQPAPQVRCALNLPPMAFSVSLIARVSPTIARAFSE